MSPIWEDLGTRITNRQEMWHSIILGGYWKWLCSTKPQANTTNSSYECASISKRSTKSATNATESTREQGSGTTATGTSTTWTTAAWPTDCTSTGWSSVSYSGEKTDATSHGLCSLQVDLIVCNLLVFYSSIERHDKLLKIFDEQWNSCCKFWWTLLLIISVQFVNYD